MQFTGRLRPLKSGLLRLGAAIGAVRPEFSANGAGTAIKDAGYGVDSLTLS